MKRLISGIFFILFAISALHSTTVAGDPGAHIPAGASSLQSNSPAGPQSIAKAIDYAANYTDLTAAVKAMGPSVRNLVVDSQTRLTGDTSTPANLVLEFDGGGVVDLNGHKLTVNGAFQAGLQQCFTGSGTVALSPEVERVPQWWGAVSDGATDSTAALQAWADSISHNNAAHTPLSARLPAGSYLTKDTINFTDVYQSKIYFDGKIVANMAKPILKLTRVQHVSIYGVGAENTSVAPNAGAISGTAVYSVNFYGGKTYGGYWGIDIQGNNVVYDGINMRGAGGAGFRARSGGNNAANTIRNCGIEMNLKAAYGGLYFDSSLSPTTYRWRIENCYFEGNGTADIQVSDGFPVDIIGNYFGMDSSSPGVLLAGNYPFCYVTARDNNFVDIAGNRGKVAFKQANPGTMRLMSYSNNTVNVQESVDLYGQCPYAVNLENSRFEIAITNWDFLNLVGGAGSAPKSWTKSGGIDAGTTDSISPYGDGLAVVKETGTYLYQNITLRPQTLYKLTGWLAKDADVSSVGLEICDKTRKKKQAGIFSTSNSAVLGTIYYASGADTSATILLTVTGGTGKGRFSAIKMVDLTN